MLSAALAVTAQATLVSYDSGFVGTQIPDNSIVGLQNTLGAGAGTVLDVNVVLNIRGTYNGDLYATLTHGSSKAVLLNRVGKPSFSVIGFGDNGFDNLTLDDEAATDVHYYTGGAADGPAVTGTYQPDGRDVDPFSGDLASAARTAMLNVFDGASASGDWTLFLADASGADLNYLVSWQLNLDVQPSTGVPDSSLGGIGFSALLFGGLLTMARRRSWVHGN